MQYKFSTISSPEQTIGFSEYNQQYNGIALKVVGNSEIIQSNFVINPYSGFSFNNSVSINGTLSVNEIIVMGSALSPVAFSGKYSDLYGTPDLSVYGKLNSSGQYWSGIQTFSNGAKSLSQPSQSTDLITKGYADSTYVPQPASYTSIGSVSVVSNSGLSLSNGYISINYDPSTMFLNTLGQISSKLPTSYVQGIDSLNNTILISSQNNIYNIDINTYTSLNWLNTQTFSMGLTSTGTTTVDSLVIKNPVSSVYQELSPVSFSNNYLDLYQKPDLTVYAKPTVSNLWYQNQGFTSGATITGIPTPVNSSDVANKSYVDYCPVNIADNITTIASGSDYGTKISSIYEQYRTSVQLPSTTWNLGDERIISSFPTPLSTGEPLGSFVSLKYNIFGLYTLILNCNLKTITIESITPLNLGTITPATFLSNFDIKLYTYSKNVGGPTCYVLTLTPKFNFSSLEFTSMYLTSDGNYVFKSTLPLSGQYFGYSKNNITGIFSPVLNTVINYINTSIPNQTTIDDLKEQIIQLQEKILNIESRYEN